MKNNKFQINSNKNLENSSNNNNFLKDIRGNQNPYFNIQKNWTGNENLITRLEEFRANLFSEISG